MAKGKVKNPARVDAAVQQHLRRMDRQMRVSVVTFVVAALIAGGLVLFPPRVSKRAAVGVAFGTIACGFVAFFAGVSALSLRQRRRATRAKLVRVCQCGYDLRATDEVCPECGAPIPEALKLAREAGLDRQRVGGGAVKS